MEDFNSIANQLLIQTTELTVKLNVLTSMVMGVYSETLPRENFLSIANNFFDTLYADMEAAFAALEKTDAISDPHTLLRNQINVLLSIKQTKLQWC